MVMSMASISCVLIALGGLVLAAGVVLAIKGMRLAGALVALVGAAFIALPVLLVLYIGLVMH